MKVVNIYTPVYHRFLKTKKSIESIIKSMETSNNDVMLCIGVNGIEGGKDSLMDEWLKCLSRKQNIKVFIADKNYGKAVMVNYMFDNTRKCDYVISIDSDMISQKHGKFNWIDELINIMEWEPAKNFGLLSTWQDENNCHILDKLTEKTEFLGHWIKFGPTGTGVAGGCIIMKEKDFSDIGKYSAYDIYSGDDALLMKNVSNKLKKLVGVVETIKLTHPYNDPEEKEYQQWKIDKCRGKIPVGLDTKGFYDK